MSEGFDGIVILFDIDGNKLAESITSSLTSSSSETITFNFVWPEGDEVKLIAKWDYGGESITVEQNFPSSITVQESSEEFLNSMVWNFRWFSNFCLGNSRNQNQR